MRHAARADVVAHVRSDLTAVRPVAAGDLAPPKDWGQLTCGCHPNCGIGMPLMIDKETKEAVPVTAFLNAEQLAKDVAQVTDAARGRGLSVFGIPTQPRRNRRMRSGHALPGAGKAWSYPTLNGRISFGCGGSLPTIPTQLYVVAA